MRHAFQAQRGLRPPLREATPMHNPERDPFYEGLWADIQEGTDVANAGDLVDGEEFFAELLGEPLPVVES